MQIKIDKINKSFEKHHVLRNVELELKNSHSLSIIGPSGSGKTTILRIIAGLELPESGQLFVNNREIIFEEAFLQTYRKHVGMVFQAYNLFPHLTALENITLPLEKVHNIKKAQARETALSLLSRFRLEEHRNKRPAQLSGGQKQRIALSRAIAIDPEFLILDEPTSALDPEFTSEVLDMIEELRADDIHLILVTHEMRFIGNVADYILFMDHGQVVDHGKPQYIFHESKNPIIQRFFGYVLK